MSFYIQVKPNSARKLCRVCHVLNCKCDNFSIANEDFLVGKNGKFCNIAVFASSIAIKRARFVYRALTFILFVLQDYRAATFNHKAA